MMFVISPVKNFHNSKLYFSKNELCKILAFYSLGVSKGNWKDYAISFEKQKTSFYMFKNSLNSPDCILIKSKKQKKNIITYDLILSNRLKSTFNKIDDIITFLKRREFKVIC